MKLFGRTYGTVWLEEIKTSEHIIDVLIIIF